MSRARSISTDSQSAALTVLATLSVCHFLNDLVQALLPAVYPMLKSGFGLSYTQIGLITLTNSATSSVLQPVIGFHNDRTPRPYALSASMCLLIAGLMFIAFGTRFGALLCGAALMGVGSSIFHPESSRIARAASGGRHGFAQSLFQTGGNLGSSTGPLLAAFIVLPHGRSSLAWFGTIALVALGLLVAIGRWFAASGAAIPQAVRTGGDAIANPHARVGRTITVLLALIFSKYVYLASLTSYYMFFLIHRFGISAESAQLHLFAFLGAAAAGTFIGGPLGDRYGRKHVIWASILGVLPFTLALPYASLFWTTTLSVVIGLILASAFSAIVVYAQDLLPGRVGLVAGLFFGFAFGIAGIGAAVLGRLADLTSIDVVFRVCAFLPALGLLAMLLPEQRRAPAAAGRVGVSVAR
jgi:FSR family fosmidomycin resistance protein-like MFS transporter